LYDERKDVCMDDLFTYVYIGSIFGFGFLLLFIVIACAWKQPPMRKSRRGVSSPPKAWGLPPRAQANHRLSNNNNNRPLVQVDEAELDRILADILAEKASTGAQQALRRPQHQRQGQTRTH
jgi:hypothetical protein